MGNLRKAIAKKMIPIRLVQLQIARRRSRKAKKNFNQAINKEIIWGGTQAEIPNKELNTRHRADFARDNASKKLRSTIRKSR